MKRYLVLALRKTDFNEEVIAPHLVFLDALRADGKLEITGGFTDKSGGAYVLNAANLAEARALVDRDPLAASSQMSVYEWNTR